VNLKRLHESDVRLAVGSDIIASAVKEFDYLQKLGIFDNLTLLKMWDEATAQTIFPAEKSESCARDTRQAFLH